MNRRPTTQDVSWLLDLNRNHQLNLDPPYQRRSVWTRGDRLFFLDTIFKGFPSPAIFLHKSTADDGNNMYHVVDGKQRLETILMFVQGRLRIAKDYGDVRLAGKKWTDLEGEPALRQAFWNYQLPVEMVDLVGAELINEVFDRLNRNARKLKRQELRHARFDGWFINFVEGEAKEDVWSTLGVVTTARARRMDDCQAIAELLLVLLEGRIRGFDQDALDDAHARYDDMSDSSAEPEGLGGKLSEADIRKQLSLVKHFLISMELENDCISSHARTMANFYVLWSAVALRPEGDYTGAKAARRYSAFMVKVERLGGVDDLDSFLKSAEGGSYQDELTYWNNTRGANTEFTHREARWGLLSAALFGSA